MAELSVEPFQWDVKSELVFYKLLFNTRPVGLNRHFNMMLIYTKFIKVLQLDSKAIRVDDLWKKLKSLYDLEKLESNPESQNPNERFMIASAEQDFELPEDFASLVKAKQDAMKTH